jgi:hypothetical protein
MFGLLHPYDANLIKNKIILLTIFFIFRTKVNEGMVNFEALKNYFKRKSNFRKTHFFQELNSKHIYKYCNIQKTDMHISINTRILNLIKHL